MGPTYKKFWSERLGVLESVLATLAQGGIPSPFDVSAIISVGDRRRYQGSVCSDQKSKCSYAHLACLRKLIDPACSRYPDLAFRFCIDRTLRLTVTARQKQQLHRAPETAPATLLAPCATNPMGPAAVHTSETGNATHPSESGVESEALDPTVACEEIHRLIHLCPLYRGPEDTPFGDGLYLLFEHGETCSHGAALPSGGRKDRIVRVGRNDKPNWLPNRVDLHYKPASSAKANSVLQRHLGGALLRQDASDHPCLEHWENWKRKTCPQCAQHSARLARYLRDNCRLRFVKIDDSDARARFEELLIATVAACTVCRPSDAWLGRYARSERIKTSGLWNHDFAKTPPPPRRRISQADLEELAELVR